MKYKIIHIFVVEAKNRNEAIERFAVAKRVGNEDDYFQTEIVKKVEEDTGWVSTVKNQVFGYKR